MSKKAIIPPLFLLLFILFTPVFCYENEEVQVGTYVYTWYDTGDPVSWEYPKIVDKPVLGYYNSCASDTILTQMSQIEDAGIDFVCLNWLGVDTFSDRVVSEWFRLAKENVTSLKLSVMVEPFNETGTYNYTEIYNRAYDLYDSYESYYHTAESYGAEKPILYMYNGANLTGDMTPTFPLDSRLLIRTIGHRNYVNVWYDDIRDFVPDTVPWGQTISVLPRFDDYWQYYMGLRPNTHTIDRHLTEGLYQDQWDRAIEYANKNAIRYVFVATWNEYPERTAIEPHYDNTATDTDPYLLYTMTEAYINELHGLTVDIDPDEPWYNNPFLFGCIILGVCLGVALLWK